jgi:hypothetical protein
MSEEKSQEPSAPDADPMREQFRQALAKKQGKSSSSSAPHGVAKQVGPNSASSKTQKMFRRKSGSS